MAELKKNIKCPVCGQYIFKEEEDYDICKVCGWENEAGWVGIANGMTLDEAQAAWNQTHQRLVKPY